MTRKQRRSVFIAVCGGVLALAVGLVFYALEESVVFFYSPSDVAEKKIPPGERFRLGGLVAEGSLEKRENAVVLFAITDRSKTIKVIYTGLLPDLFREGQGVVSEGLLDQDGVFQADNILAKHDENYMPREVAESLKKQGIWRGEKEQ